MCVHVCVVSVCVCACMCGKCRCVRDVCACYVCHDCKALCDSESVTRTTHSNLPACARAMAATARMLASSSPSSSASPATMAGNVNLPENTKQGNDIK